MLVKLLTDLSFGDGSKPSGHVLEIPDAQAETLIAMGLVEKATSKPAAVKAPVEAAALAEPPEQATLPKGQKR